MMKPREQRSSLRGFFQSRLFLVLTTLVLFLITFSYIRAYYEDYQVRQKIKELQDQVQSLEGKKLESLHILQYVNSENFIEDKARTELNLKKPGENVVFVDGVTSVSTTKPVLEDTVDEPHLSNPLKWWYYFTHQQQK